MLCPAKVVYANTSDFQLIPKTVSTVEITQQVIDVVPPDKKSVIRRLEALAKDYGVDTELALYVAEYESGFDANSIGDMDITCKQGINKGKPIRARGIFQWTECYWPNITDEQAFNLEWSIIKAMPYLKNKDTCVTIWTTCRKYYNEKER